jgi:hypothetical protein
MTSPKTLLIATALTLGLTTAAQAAECQLRNINFVSTVSDGRLVVNAEIWSFNGSQWVSVGNLGNSTYCNVNSSLNGISAATCKNWYQMAMAAMLANKKIYITANACTAGNGVNLSGLGYFGLNH